MLCVDVWCVAVVFPWSLKSRPRNRGDGSSQTALTVPGLSPPSLLWPDPAAPMECLLACILVLANAWIRIRYVISVIVIVCLCFAFLYRFP